MGAAYRPRRLNTVTNSSFTPSGFVGLSRNLWSISIDAPSGSDDDRRYAYDRKRTYAMAYGGLMRIPNGASSSPPPPPPMSAATSSLDVFDLTAVKFLVQREEEAWQW